MKSRDSYGLKYFSKKINFTENSQKFPNNTTNSNLRIKKKKLKN